MFTNIPSFSPHTCEVGRKGTVCPLQTRLQVLCLHSCSPEHIFAISSPTLYWNNLFMNILKTPVSYQCLECCKSTIHVCCCEIERRNWDIIKLTDLPMTSRKMGEVEPEPRSYFSQVRALLPHTEAAKHRKQHPQKSLLLFLRALWSIGHS